MINVISVKPIFITLCKHPHVIKFLSFRLEHVTFSAQCYNNVYFVDSNGLGCKIWDRVCFI